jgi:heat induced stress protein YflT
VRIVGTGLRSVEQVTGRLTKGRAAAGGALTGAGFGLLIGLLFAILVIGPFGLGVVLSSVIFGALWGAVIGFVGHWATRGRRDFSSVRGLEAESYAVQVDAGYEDEAARAAGIA